ncbi:MAG TPA: Mur ligase domain-containing protein, partial [Rhabdochlamydiaceae bacterium]
MHALVIGLGVSGKAAALLLKQKGYAVTGVDAKSKEIEGIVVLPESAVQDVKDYDLVVLSPGIAADHPLYLAAKQENKNIVGE